MATPAREIFISYPTRTGGVAARALEAALGPERVFLDQSNLEHGKPFPQQIFDGLADARVVICLLDEAYFESWFCRAELEVALTALRESGAPLEASGLVLAAADWSKAAAFRALPPSAKQVQWPTWDEVEAIVRLIEAQGSACSGRIRDRIPEHHLQGLQEWIQSETLMQPRSAIPAERLRANLPARPAGRFFGRARHLNGIHARLLTPEGPGHCAIVAPGGGGKTRLAREYLWRHASRDYPGGCIWIDAGTPGTEEQQLHLALQQLIPDLPDLAALKRANVDLRQRLQTKLAERSELGPVLWVIDDIPEPAPGERPRPLTDWCVELPGQVAVLATSRMQQSPRAINVVLDQLAREDSIAMLTHELPAQRLSRTRAEQISAAVGDWPLALELLNRSFAEDALTPAEFLELHRRSGIATVLDDTMDVLRDQVPEGALRGITETLLFSYERLPTEAQRLARVLGHCAPMEPIPYSVLESLGTEVAVARARSALKARSLVSEATGESYGQLHPLVADFLRHQDTTGQDVLALGEAILCCIDFEKIETPSEWPTYNTLLPHLEACADAGQIGAGIGLELSRAILRIHTTQARYHSLGAADSALTRWGDASAARDSWLRLQSSLGNSLVLSGKRAAGQQLLEAALAAQCEALGADHIDALATRYLLGVSLCNQAQFTEAIAELELVVAGYERLRGPLHPSTLNARSQLGNAYHGLFEFARARQLLEEVLHEQERQHGEVHRHTLRTRQYLGLVLKSLGEYLLARECLEGVLTGQESLFGESSPTVASTRANLAYLLESLGELSLARTHNEKAIAAKDRVHGPDHPDALIIQGNLVRVLTQLGELEQARAVGEATLAAYRTKPRRLKFAIGLEANLIAVRRLQGDLVAARQLAEEVLPLQRQEWGETHTYVMETQREMGLVLLAQGELTAAREELNAVMTLRMAESERDEFARVRAAWALYQVMQAQGDPQASSFFAAELAWLESAEAASLEFQVQLVRDQIRGWRAAASDVSVALVAEIDRASNP